MPTGRKISGIEVVLILVCIVLLLSFSALLVALLLVPQESGRSLCGTRLRGIGTALALYAIEYRGELPIAGSSQPDASALGFAEGDRHTGRGAKLDNNVTGTYWLLVKTGISPPTNFLCDKDSTAEPDALTHDGTKRGSRVALANTSDFSSARNLSYSMFNMHHVTMKRFWHSNANADVPFMSDDNDNYAPNRHTLSKGSDPRSPSAMEIQALENSSTHKGEGQNVLFGDSHTSFEDDPFIGIRSDNVFAMIKGGKNAPPTFGNSDGDAAKDPDDLGRVETVLLPITGNGGGAGSLDPTD
jgi:hypothetical protein